MAENVDVEEGRRLLAEVREARNGIDGDRVADALEAWQNWAFAHADALLSAASPPAEDGVMDVLRSLLPSLDGYGQPCSDCESAGCVECDDTGWWKAGDVIRNYVLPAPTPADPEEGDDAD